MLPLPHIGRNKNFPQRKGSATFMFSFIPLKWANPEKTVLQKKANWQMYEHNLILRALRQSWMSIKKRLNMEMVRFF